MEDRDFLKIGGKRVDVRLLYRHVNRFKSRFNRLIDIDRKMRKRGSYYNFDSFMFYTVWKCIEKRGIWPFGKPFRSLRHMILNVRVDEIESIKNFWSVRILGMPSEDREPGKEPVKN